MNEGVVGGEVVGKRVEVGVVERVDCMKGGRKRRC